MKTEDEDGLQEEEEVGSVVWLVVVLLRLSLSRSRARSPSSARPACWSPPRRRPARRHTASAIGDTGDKSTERCATLRQIHKMLDYLHNSILS